jgi:putative isomerase
MKNLTPTASSSGKKSWQPMLKYLAELHRKSTHHAAWLFDYEWEEIGPGYEYVLKKPDKKNK